MEQPDDEEDERKSQEENPGREVGQASGDVEIGNGG
jgi:hypothetical protein